MKIGIKINYPARTQIIRENKSHPTGTKGYSSYPQKTAYFVVPKPNTQELNLDDCRIKRICTKNNIIFLVGMSRNNRSHTKSIFPRNGVDHDSYPKDLLANRYALKNINKIRFLKQHIGINTTKMACEHLMGSSIRTAGGIIDHKNEAR